MACHPFGYCRMCELFVYCVLVTDCFPSITSYWVRNSKRFGLSISVVLILILWFSVAFICKCCCLNIDTYKDFLCHATLYRLIDDCFYYSWGDLFLSLLDIGLDALFFFYFSLVFDCFLSSMYLLTVCFNYLSWILFYGSLVTFICECWCLNIYTYRDNFYHVTLYRVIGGFMVFRAIYSLLSFLDIGLDAGFGETRNC